MNKKILITGGTGFLGFHLAKELCKNKDYEIILVDNFFRSKKDKDLEELLRINSNLKLIEADLTSIKELEKLGQGYDQVYHFAAVNGTRNFYEIPDKVLRCNVLCVINILDWFLKNRKESSKIVFASSSETYANTIRVAKKFPIPTPEDVALSIEDVNNPRWCYAGSKIVGELFFINYARVYDFKMSIVRFHNIYGPRMGYGHVIPEFLQRINQKESPFKIFGGRETRSFCYVDDMVQALKKVMEKSETNGEIINIGNDQEEISIKELAQKIFKTANFYPEIDIKPAPPGSTSRRCPDLTKIRKLTGYEPLINLEEGLKRTHQWYKEENDNIINGGKLIKL